MIDLKMKPLTESSPADLRSYLDDLHEAREKYDLAKRVVEVRSCDLEIAEAARALAIVNRRATERQDAQAVDPLARLREALVGAVSEVVHHNSEYKHVTPIAQIEEWRAVISEAVLTDEAKIEARAEAIVSAERISEGHQQREADLGEAFLAGCEYCDGWIDEKSRMQSGADSDEQAAAEYARSKVGG